MYVIHTMKYIFFSWLLILPFLCKASSDTLILKKSISLDCKYFTTDPTGNIYAVVKNNNLIKYNLHGDSIGVFNEIKKGKITQIDANNPLRILVYFAEYGQLVILDNLLTLKSNIRLNLIGIINAPCIAISADANIWTFDPLGMLVKINEKPSIVFSLSLRNLLENAIYPQYMTELGRNLFIADTTEGLFQFDVFGFFKKKFPIFAKEIQWFNDYIVYYQAPHLISYHTITFNEKKLTLPRSEDILQVRMERNLVYILRKEKIDIYELRQI